MRPTKRTADRHEALVLRLEALVRPIEAIAARRPDEPVPASLARAAEALLFDARRFTRQRGIPAAAPAYAGLAVQLSAARARLEAFELRHTAWDPALKCVVWITEGEKLPLRRLRPQPAIGPRSPAQERETEKIRLKLARMIDARYEQGYDDALAGRPREDSRVDMVKSSSQMR